MSISLFHVSLSNLISCKQVRDVTVESAERMANSFRNVDQLSPIGIEETTKQGFYKVRFGYTRVAAAELLGWDTILAQVFPPESEPGGSLRAAVMENTVREQMTFMELADVVGEYAKLKGIPISKAASELGFSQSLTCKCLKADSRLTDANKKKLLDAGIGGSLAYLISKETRPKEQTDLVKAVIDEKWTRKQIEAHFRKQQTSTTRVEYRHGTSSIRVDVPRDATPEQLMECLKGFAGAIRKCNGHSLETMARILKEQFNVAA